MPMKQQNTGTPMLHKHFKPQHTVSELHTKVSQITSRTHKVSSLLCLKLSVQGKLCSKFDTVNPMQSHTSEADGHADPKPNGHPAPLNKWIIINGQALIPYNPLFSKKA